MNMTVQLKNNNEIIENQTQSNNVNVEAEVTTAELIERLQAQIEEMKMQLKSKKQKPEKRTLVKPYAKKNGHYFIIEKGETEEHVRITTQVGEMLKDEDVRAKLEQKQLGRACIEHFEKTGRIVLWAPNQEQLMFGPILSGIKNAKEYELFTPNADVLVDLGNGLEGDRPGRTALDIAIDFEKFKAKEQDFEELKKLMDKMEMLRQKEMKAAAQK
jgi:hypothetical protein